MLCQVSRSFTFGGYVALFDTGALNNPFGWRIRTTPYDDRPNHFKPQLLMSLHYLFLVQA